MIGYDPPSAPHLNDPSGTSVSVTEGKLTLWKARPALGVIYSRHARSLQESLLCHYTVCSALPTWTGPREAGGAAPHWDIIVVCEMPFRGEEAGETAPY